MRRRHGVLMALWLSLGCAEATDTDPASDADAYPGTADTTSKIDAQGPAREGSTPPDAVAGGSAPTNDSGFEESTSGDLGPPSPEASAFPDVTAVDLEGRDAPFEDRFAFEVSPIDRPGLDLSPPRDLPVLDLARPDMPTVLDTGPPPVDIPAPLDRCPFALCGGACVDTQSDAHNCGGCGNDCGVIVHVRSGAIRCVAGACSIPEGACENNFGDCNLIPSDGCEAELSRSEHCGRCSTACAEPSPLCAPGAGGGFGCTSGCPSTQRRCAMSCTDVATDLNNCGDCARRCAAPAGASPTCRNGACGFSCAAGSHVCGASCAIDTSPASCGSSCSPCPVPANGSAACTAGRCAIACNPGFYASSASACSPLFCGTGAISCAGGSSCPVNGSCLAGGGCQCNPGTVATTCTGAVCTSCTFPNLRCAPIFCGGGAVLCGDGGYCPANSYCYSGSRVCLCLGGFRAVTCTGVSCGTSCVFPGWRCIR